MFPPVNVSYFPTLPNPPDDPGDDVSGMQINSSSIQQVFQVDHYAFGSNQGGTHQQVRLAEYTFGSVPTFQNTYETLYSTVPPPGPNGEIYFVRGNQNPNSAGIRLTGPGTPSAGANGYTFMAGGLLIQWGVVTFPSTGGFNIGTVTFATANIAFPNNCFVVIPQYIATGTTSSTNTMSITTISKTSFSWNNTASSRNQYSGFYWIAIGN